MEIKEIIKSGYEKTKFGWISNDWNLISIDEITDRITNRVEVEEEKLYREIGIRSHGKGLFHKEEVTGKSLGNKRVFWIEPDCFVVNIVFAWEQAVSKTTEDEVGMIASHRFPIYKPKKGILDLDYLLYFFKTPLGKHLLGLASPGGAGRNKTLGQKEFGKLILPLPSIQEQRKIVFLINSWNSNIDLIQNLIVTKTAKKNFFLNKIFEKKIKFKDYKDEWNLLKLKNCINTPPSYGINAPAVDYSVELPTYLRITDIDEDGYFTLDKKKSVKNPESSNYILKEGDIVFVRTGSTTGKSYLYDCKDGILVYAGFLIKFKVNKNILHPPFLKIYTESEKYRKWVGVMSMRSGQPGINSKEYSSLEIPIPCLAEQKKISLLINTMKEETRILKEKLRLIRKQKKGLMQQLLTGKIRTVNEE